MIVKVQFKSANNPSGFGGGAYSYYTSMPLQVGDIVSAPVSSGHVKARVVSVNVSQDDIGVDAKRLGTISELTEQVAQFVGLDTIVDGASVNGGGNANGDDNHAHCSELPLFRRRYREFAHVPDARICELAEFARPWAGRHMFRRLRPQAVIALIAHWLKMAELAEEYADGTGPVTSISEDGGSESYSVSQVNLSADNAYLKETEYGRAFMAMRHSFISV